MFCLRYRVVMNGDHGATLCQGLKARGKCQDCMRFAAPGIMFKPETTQGHIAMRKKIIKNCPTCKKEYQARGSRQKECDTCNPPHVTKPRAAAPAPGATDSSQDSKVIAALINMRLVTSDAVNTLRKLVGGTHA